jgi:hypothetical protein
MSGVSQGGSGAEDKNMQILENHDWRSADKTQVNAWRYNI